MLYIFNEYSGFQYPSGHCIYKESCVFSKYKVFIIIVIILFADNYKKPESCVHT